MPQRTDRRTLLATGATGLAGLAGCSSIPGMGGGGDDGDGGGDGGTTTAPPTQTDNPTGFEIRMGMIAPTSGDLSIMGGEMVDVGELLVEQVDTMPTEHSLELAIEETDGTPSAAVDAATSLRDDGYEAIVGPASDEALIEVAEQVYAPGPDSGQDPVLGISPFASSQEVLDIERQVHNEDLDTDVTVVYSAAPTPTVEGTAFSKALFMSGVMTQSILYEDTLHGRSVLETTRDEITTRMPGDDIIKAEVALESGADSYSDAVATALEDDPAGLVLIANPRTGFQVIKDYYAEHGDKPLFASTRLHRPELQAELQESPDNLMMLSSTPDWWDDNPPGGQNTTAVVPDSVKAEFHRAWIFEHGVWPTYHAALTYDCLMTEFLSIIAAGETSYDAGIIADEIKYVINRQESQDVLPVGLDWTNFFERQQDGKPWIVPLADGQFNYYTGPSGSVVYNPQNGAMSHPSVVPWVFSDETHWGWDRFDPFEFGVTTTEG